MKVSERDWQRTVCAALDATAWRYSHTYPLRTQHGREPDC